MNKDLVITVIADGKKFNEVVEITSPVAEMALGRMNFRVGPGSELHDLFSVDSPVPILCGWAVGINRPWFEIQSNPDNTYYVNFTKV